MTYRYYQKKLINDNEGFSLVELIICVAILAIAAIPLMSAFSTSGIVIGKAQSVQNATSVAESVMEEIKGSSIEQLKHHTNYGYKTDTSISYSGFSVKSAADKIAYGSGKIGSKDAVLIQQEGKSFYVFYKPDVKADADPSSADGEKYDVVATIDATTRYNTTDAVGTAEDANSIELPVIERIDKGKHAVISKEINRLDSSVVETWKDNYRDKMHLTGDADPAYFSTLKITKEVEIDIDDPTNSDEPTDHEANIECTVRYYDTSKGSFASDDCHVSEKVYSGSFLGTLDTRAYIFYQTARQSIHTNNVVNSLSNTETVINKENIIIKSTSTDSRVDNPRQVYFILQEDKKHSTSDSNYYMLGAGNTLMTITANDGSGSVAVSANSQNTLSADGVIESTNKSLKVITNLPKTITDKTSFYYNEKDDYIYEVDVYVYDKNGTERAHLLSTKDAERTPTPTPIPTE